MGYDRPVLKALEAAEELEVLLEADFDVEHSGFTWWHGYGLDGVALTGVMDYLYGLVAAVQENLRSAAVHLADLGEARYVDDHALIRHLRQNGRVPNHRERGELEARRDARIHAHEAGVLRATGSILDTLAGVVVGVGGFNANVLRADLGWLQPFTDGSGYPGREVRKRLNLTEQVLDPDDPQGNLLRATPSRLLARVCEWTTDCNTVNNAGKSGPSTETRPPVSGIHTGTSRSSNSRTNSLNSATVPNARS